MSARGNVEVWVDATEEVIASEECHTSTVMEPTDTPIQKLLDTMVHEGDGFFDDGFYCSECRSMFQNMTDPNAINGPSFILDSPTIMGGPQRALLSLPHGLMIARSSIPNAGLGVVNQGPTVSPGMHFGPYEGEVTTRMDAMGSEYSWEICKGKDKWEYIDGASEMHSNWMRYVNCARSEQEKNLLAVQYKDSVMFHCCRTIQQGDELLVWPSGTLLCNLSPAWNQIWFMKQTPTANTNMSSMASQNFTCPQCQLPFTTETYLQRHTEYFHMPRKKESARPPSATETPNTSSVVVLVDHRSGGPPVIVDHQDHDSHDHDSHDHDGHDDQDPAKEKLCADCGKTFKHDHHLTRHQRCVHANKRPYCCPLCRRSFSQASGLLRHQLVHRKPQSMSARVNQSKTTVYEVSESDSKEAPDGAVLVRRFTSGATEEQRSGTEEPEGLTEGDDEIENDEVEDFPDEQAETAKTRRAKSASDNKCLECGKSFTNQGYLKKHTLTVHNNVRPYVCTVCRKSFGQHHDLARHLKQHKVKRSHKQTAGGFWCANCSLTFSTEEDLKQHANLLHRMQEEPEGNDALPEGNDALPEGNDALPDKDNVLPGVHVDDQGDDPDFVVDPSEAKAAESDESPPRRRPQRLGARSKLSAITKLIAPKRKGGKKARSDPQAQEEEADASPPKGKKPRKWYVCVQCKGTYESPADLKAHKCTAKQHTCVLCGMVFKKSGFLKRHEKTAHAEGMRSYTCDQCQKVFKKLSNLKQHQKTKRCEKHHYASELFPCDFCEFSFTLKSYLRKHVRRHHPVEYISNPDEDGAGADPQEEGETPNICPHCGKHYVSVKHFKAHACFQELRVVFLCTDCGKGFANHYGLKQHQRIHTGEKPYKCQHCAKGFSYVGQLNVHVRTHTGEKPYLCTHCGESFRQSGDLKRHERKHTGVKPHNCPNCFKSFSRLQSLKAHMMLHLGQRKFKCTQCPRSFSRNYHLRRHHQKMHSASLGPTTIVQSIDVIV